MSRLEDTEIHDDTASVADRLRRVNQRIEAACARADRDPRTVRLLLATKTVAAERIRPAIEAGCRLIGENKVQEAAPKHRALQTMGVSHEAAWHMIGHLQSNKVKHALRFADCIQSLDRARLVERLDRRLQYEGRAINVMLQFNTSGEASKYGADPDDAIAFARSVARCDTLRVVGLMTIGRFGAEPEVARESFRALRQVRNRLLAKGINRIEPRELSMGMSGDMEVAIDEGATMVRVGTAIFGPRPHPDAYYWPGAAGT